MYEICMQSLTNRGAVLQVCMNMCVHFYICDCLAGSTCLCVYTCANAGMKARWQMAGGRQSHVDGKTGRRDRRTRWPVDMEIPLFSMAWIRLTRAVGAVSGGVNCSLRSSRETAETTPQITVTLLAQSP